MASVSPSHSRKIPASIGSKLARQVTSGDGAGHIDRRLGSSSLPALQLVCYEGSVGFVRLLLGGVLALAGCGRTPPNATPEGAVREFTERLTDLDGSEAASRAVYELLSEAARANLQARADRYSNASGRQRAPWAMLVPSRTRFHFSPQSFEAQVVGRYALVKVLGVSPGDIAQVPCVLQGDAWQIDLVLPELAELPKRRSVPGP